MEKVDYGKTLNLPQTEFPMRGNLPKKEPEMLEFWDSNDIYNKVAEKNATIFVDTVGSELNDRLKEHLSKTHGSKVKVGKYSE